jgi:hypothetical protein
LENKGLLRVAEAIQRDFLTGALWIEGAAPGEETQRLEVLVRQGRVLQVDCQDRELPWRLGQMVVRGSYINGPELPEALKLAREKGVPLGAVLLKQRSLEKAQLAELLHVQFLEDLHRAAAWTQGTWRFEARDVKKRMAAPPPLNLTEAIEAGLAQQSVWGALEAVVPSDESTWDKTHQGPVSQELARSAGLSKRELRVFSLVHHSRDVLALVALARLERFEIYRSLAMLQQANLVAMHDAGRPRARRSQVNARAMGRGLVKHITTAALIAAALLLGVWIFLENRDEGGVEGDQEVVVRKLDPWQEALVEGQIERLRHALGAYRARHGDYPVTLPVLVQEGLLQKDDLTFPGFARSYAYRTSKDGFVLVRPKR